MTGVAMYRAKDLLQNPVTHPVLPDVGFDLIPYDEDICCYRFEKFFDCLSRKSAFDYLCVAFDGYTRFLC